MKVAIVGTAPTSRQVAPFDDRTWAIWACSPGNAPISPGAQPLPRVDIWFELHALAAIRGPENRAWAVPYMGWLRNQSFPVYMQERNELVPSAIPFPIREVIKQFGRNWLSSSITMMGFYALMRGAKEIGFFGVDMAADQEHYTAQRAGCWRLIEICRERGVAVTIPHESCLGQPPVIYGYNEATRMGRRLELRKAELANQRQQIAGQIEKLTRDLCHVDGAIEANNYMLRTFVNGEDAEIDFEEAPQPAPTLADRTVPGGYPVQSPASYKPNGSGVLVPADAQRT